MGGVPGRSRWRKGSSAPCWDCALATDGLPTPRAFCESLDDVPGQARVVVPGTAGVHVSNILRKLGMPSRVQAPTFAERAGLGPPKG